MENPISPEVKQSEADHPETTDKDVKGEIQNEGQSEGKEMPLPPPPTDESNESSFNEGDQSNVADSATDDVKEKDELVHNIHEEVPDTSIDQTAASIQDTDGDSKVANKHEPQKKDSHQEHDNATPVEQVEQPSSVSEQVEDEPVGEENTGEQETDSPQHNEDESVSDAMQTEDNTSQQIATQPQDEDLKETDGSSNSNQGGEQEKAQEEVPVNQDVPMSPTSLNPEQEVSGVQENELAKDPEIVQENSSSLPVEQDQHDGSILAQDAVDVPIVDSHKENADQELHPVKSAQEGDDPSVSQEADKSGAPANEDSHQEETLPTEPAQTTSQEADPTSREIVEETHTAVTKAPENQEKKAVESGAVEKKEEVKQPAEAQDVDADLDSITNMIESMAIVGTPEDIPASNETSTIEKSEQQSLDSQKDAAGEQPGASHPEPYRLTKDSHSSETEMENAKAVAAAATVEHDLSHANEAEREVGDENRPTQLPVSSPSSSLSRPEPTPPGEMLHHIKQVQFKDKDVGIVTQNENGPCPLVAIINVLLLRWQITLSPSTEIVSAAKLMEYIGDTMLESVPKNLSGEVRLNYEQNMHDAMAVLPKLQTGLDVNVKFTGVKDFEYTPECIIFDLLRIPLFHGWLVDPQAKEVAKAVGQAGYNQLVEKVISQKCSTNEDAVTEALIIENFLERTASQLTYHGLTELNAAMSDGEIGVLFRNNHFSTIYKHQKELLQLVTDQGFLGESSVVWETLSGIDGDGQFVDSNFRTVPPKPEASGASPSPNTSGHLTAEQQIDHDFLVALSLQDEQQPAAIEEAMECEPAAMSDEEKTTQEKADEELARQLQQEEERQAAEAAREASPGASQQQAQEAQSARSPTQQPKKKDNCNIL